MRHRMGAASGARPLLIAVVLGAVAAQSPTPAPTCDAIEVAGTDSDISTGSFDGLYDQAGECNGQPYYKCTCCTDYDPDVVEMCAADPEGCADENGGAWDQSQCMADIGGGGVHHYVFYSSDDAAWYLKLYFGDGSGTDDGWDECGTVGDFGRGNEYRLEPWWGSLAGSAGRLWELRTSYSGWGEQPTWK